MLIDLYTVQDFPYNPQELKPSNTKDKFEGYRPLESEDYSNWIQAIEECGN